VSSTGIIFNIQRFSVHDGPGIRATVFFKGCPLGCWWCHNPESKSFDIEDINGKTLGKKYTVDELFTEIEKDRVFFEESKGGITFSGGEPLAQPDFLEEIINKCRENGIRTAVDTSGYTDKNIIKRFIHIADLFLYDIKLIDPVLHLKYTDISNTEILQNLDYLMAQKTNIIIRIPLIPGITATDENIKQIKDYLLKYNIKPEINLLPFHKIAEHKYKKYGIKYHMNKSFDLKDEQIKQFKSIFTESGFNVKLGG